MQRGICRGNPAGAHSLLWLENDVLCLELASRKNRQGGSGVIKRQCTCRGNPVICPVHILWHQFAAGFGAGHAAHAKGWAGGPNVDASGAILRSRPLALPSRLSCLPRQAKLLPNKHLPAFLSPVHSACARLSGRATRRLVLSFPLGRFRPPSGGAAPLVWLCLRPQPLCGRLPPSFLGRAPPPSDTSSCASVSRT